MSAFLLPNTGGGQESNRVRHGQLVVHISPMPFVGIHFYFKTQKAHETPVPSPTQAMPDGPSLYRLLPR